MRSFFLTLPETPERTAKAVQHFKERGVRSEKFEGIHAEKFGLRTVFPYEVDNPGTNYFIGFKSIGNILSHYVLWSALNLLYDDYYLILEDDAQFPLDWHTRFIDAIQKVPKDFDMLYVGSCCCQNQPKALIAGQVWEVKYPCCTHAYVVAKKALPTLLRTQRKIYAPIDISLVFHSLPLLKVYTVLPSIVSQFDTVLSP